MGAYDNDRRVVRLNNGDYLVAWTFRQVGGRWAAFNQDGELDEQVGWCDSADVVIAGVIGDPR